ncbi:MAG: HemK2/MTQ2 family protein methyltransferase [Candidatus Jordarchaeum sp.]|uniref:HemK2/MTQ2 family protein methyltransferase n=1 Tax=Candidatus Jordarchaeum sp. TaxID=2823881 RepID=UPI00404A8A5E
MKSFDYQGFKFLVFEDVYEPSEDSFLIADNLIVSENDYVLDMGTGCGILAIIAGSRAKKVVGIDISERAVANAKMNVNLNKMEGYVEIRLGDLWSALKPDERFSLILFNPPYLPISKAEKNENNMNIDMLEKAWDGGLSGREIINEFLAKFDNFLEDDGQLQVVLSSLSGIEKTLSSIENKGFKFEKKAEKKFFFENLVLINLKRVRMV